MIKYLRLLFAAILFLAFSKASAQNVYQPYSYQFYQKLNSAVYGKESRFHSSLKPFRVDDSTIVARYYELINLGVDTGASTWLKRKLTNEHLVDVRKQGYTFYADVLGDVQLGKDFGTSEKTIWTNTRGYQVGGTIGKTSLITPVV